MFNWLRSKQGQTAQDNEPTGRTNDEVIELARNASVFSTHAGDFNNAPRFSLNAKLEALKAFRPVMPKPMAGATREVAAMDEADGFDAGCVSGYAGDTDGMVPNVSDALANWYGSQTFIGHQLAAIIAQHWLIWKACSTPSRDAIRNGFDIVTSDGDDVPAELNSYLRRADKRYGLKRNLRQFVTMGRVFGVRICIFKVESSDKDYYLKPFNIDGVTEGSYKGMVQVDPYWCSPVLNGIDASQPDTMHFYEPTWWIINGKRYHRSHLAIFRNGEVADILKPQYLYGGIPVPQLIMERVYGSERTANEAPLLALTKRTMVYKTDTAKALAKGWDVFAGTLTQMARLWNNHGTRVIGEEDEVSQIDTSLSDLDAIIMTQYQLVAAASNVPSTKLLGTAPKGFNATGEYDEANYHEELESLQEHDLSPLVDRHHQLVMASMPQAERAKFSGITLETAWLPLDTPTAKEIAEINKLDADADAQLVTAGAIDAIDARRRIATNKTSNYAGIAVPDALAEIPDEPAATPGIPQATAPTVVQ